MKKIIIPLLLITSIFVVGCAEQTGVLEPSLVGTWKSELVTEYYYHYKIFGSDGSYAGRWVYADTGALYSQIGGTWSVDGDVLTTVTNHTDTYNFRFVDDNTVEILIDGEYRTYYRE